MARPKSKIKGKTKSALKKKHAHAGSGIGTPVLVGGAVALVGALIGVFWWANQQTALSAVDDQTLCPLATGPVEMRTILLDLTDPLSPAQHSQLMAWIDDEIDRAPRGTQFTMGVVSEDAGNWGATDPLCKPQDAASVSALTQNARLVGDRYQERFLAPLKASLESMVSATGANKSPIMEGLQALVSDSPGFVTYDGPRRVILVTDLLQNSDVLSFYGGGDWESFEGSPHFQRIGTTLSGAEVQIYQVPRPADAIKDPAAVEDFWVRYFEKQGAHKPAVKLLGDL